MALVKQYKIEIDGQQANATVGQLKAEVERLEEALEGVVLGSPEADAFIRELGRAKATLKDLDESVDVAFDKDRAGAYVDAISGLAGAFEVATVAAQQFGLTEEDAAKYQQRLTEMIAVVQGLESVHRLTTAEVSTALKGLFGDAKKVVLGYLGIGQASTTAGAAATASANTTRIALLSIGLGAILVVLGLVAANWDRITAAVERNKGKIIDSLKFIAPPLFVFIKGLELIEKKFGSMSAFASGALGAIVANFKELGAILGDLASFDPKAAFERAKKLGETTAQGFQKGVLEKQLEQSAERAKALVAQAIEGNARLIAVEEAAGRDTYGLKLQQLRDELSLLKRGTAEEIKAYKDKNNEILVLEAAHAKKLADDKEKADKEAAAKAKAAAEKAKQAAEKAATEAFAANQKRLAELGDGTLDSMNTIRAANEKVAADFDAAARKFFNLPERAEKVPDQLAGIVDQAKEKIEAKTVGFGERILIGLFGVGPDSLEAVKEQVNAAVAGLSSSLTDTANALLEVATEAADARLTAVQERLQQLDDELQDKSAAADETESQLAKATGARRDFLLQKLTKERDEESRLRQEKARAAKEEQQALKEKHKLELQGQRITATSTLAASAYNAVLATQAALEAVKQGSKMPFPLNLVAVVAALAAVASTVVSARNLARKFERGGLLTGPAHAQGGIRGTGAFADVEVEGGEFIVNKRATARYRPLLEAINSASQTRVLPSPRLRGATHFEQGGVLPAAGAAGGSSQVLVEKADLAQLNGYLAQIAAHTGLVASFGPSRLTFGPEEAQRVRQEQADAQALVAANRL